MSDNTIQSILALELLDSYLRIWDNERAIELIRNMPFANLMIAQDKYKPDIISFELPERSAYDICGIKCKVMFNNSVASTSNTPPPKTIQFVYPYIFEKVLGRECFYQDYLLKIQQDFFANISPQRLQRLQRYQILLMPIHQADNDIIDSGLLQAGHVGRVEGTDTIITYTVGAHSVAAEQYYYPPGHLFNRTKLRPIPQQLHYKKKQLCHMIMLNIQHTSYTLPPYPKKPGHTLLDKIKSKFFKKNRRYYDEHLNIIAVIPEVLEYTVAL